jgi:Fe-S cluster biogenesis protein NfuA
MPEFTIFYEATPNPQSMKFNVAAMIADESMNFTSANDCARSPLARKIFGFPWAAGVFVGPNFITVTKQEWVDWDVLAEPLSGLIKEHLERGEPVLLKAVTEEEDTSNDTDTVRLIKQILREEIRPAVAMDGGDIVFQKFENGRVYLHMQGACAGCPSSAMTLKEGIETRLKAAVPDVVEVVST